MWNTTIGPVSFETLRQSYARILVKAVQAYAENSITDFNVILFNGKRFSVDTYNGLHQDNLAFLKSELDEEWIGKTVVATHMFPHSRTTQKMQTDPLNEVFALEQIVLT